MVSGPIVLSPNVSEFCVFVETFDDQALEINESMAAELLLSQYKSRVTVSPEVTNVFIIDNDGELGHFLCIFLLDQHPNQLYIHYLCH